MHVDTISTLNEISARPPAAVGVPNGNGGVMCEYGLDDFIQIKHDCDDNVHGGDIKYKPPVNIPKVIITSWYN